MYIAGKAKNDIATGNVKNKTSKRKENRVEVRMMDLDGQCRLKYDFIKNDLYAKFHNDRSVNSLTECAIWYKQQLVLCRNI